METPLIEAYSLPRAAHLRPLQPHAGTRGVSRRNSWVVRYHTAARQPLCSLDFIYHVGDDPTLVLVLLLCSPDCSTCLCCSSCSFGQAVEIVRWVRAALNEQAMEAWYPQCLRTVVRAT